tara:strand:- start:561 stop:977 length:417 start_codon:yes stop_codon:yes gene_type:complete
MLQTKINISMIAIQINVSYLNVSLQVGDLVYARNTTVQAGAKDAQQDLPNGQYTPTNIMNIVGILLEIVSISPSVFELRINNASSSYTPGPNDFIMFSKHNQSMGDVLGYYAQARFINDSTEKAEIFSVGSEVIINSK